MATESELFCYLVSRRVVHGDKNVLILNVSYSEHILTMEITVKKRHHFLHCQPRLPYSRRHLLNINEPKKEKDVSSKAPFLRQVSGINCLFLQK